MNVRLKTAASYRGHGVTVTKIKPCIDVDDELAAVLIGSGFFVPAGASCPACSPPQPEALPNRAISVTDLMTTKEMKEYAKKHGIDISGARTKAQIAEIIRAVEGQVHGESSVDPPA